MPKNKDEKSKKEKTPKEHLTEWQQRNLEFLKRKREREAEQRRQEKEAKDAAKAAIKALETRDDDVEELEPEPVKKVKREPRIPKKEKIKALPILLSAFIMMLVSVFMLSPYSKQKTIKVAGAKHANETAILKASNIGADDYLTTVWFNKSKHAQAVVSGNEWIKSAKLTYQFPNHFTIEVEEFKIVAYTDTEDGYRPILENGRRPQTTPVNQLPKDYIAINLADEKKIQKIIHHLSLVDESIVDKIDTIDPLEGAVTKDMLLLGMKDGHQVRVPLARISKRLPYYSQIAPKLTEPSIVDMEIGIYSTTENLEAILAQNRLENANKSKDESVPEEESAEASSEEVPEQEVIEEE